ncbi:MAG: CTP synthase [Candidatus Harrisonbacteria bacterium RIFCSPLOWO2_01_FULL_40_28]|uniref:CTP synthase n=1 Tax=Candidatus Harrisonbacteria bacterium RIFCSPLOWO2_01_FULL_40_28 TaxID=1798406 RepID=A0A1G1ZKN0_9BACT|nr:MAG: CTP synthase [Candidatus Harrisonbacteria bacterium RIFCSPLOWO2_01_FULL_40_28]
MSKKLNLKYVFVVGGVMSGVGKGVAAASIGKILQSRNFNVTATKIDPYVNVDAGTMNPTEHGEVFVLDDGTECDQDMGNYERFLNCDLASTNYMTTGSVYQTVINRERNLGYGGKCVEVVPHIPLEILSRIDKAAAKNNADIIITEIGGTVGEYQNVLFLEAVRMLKLRKPNDVVLVLVSYLPLQGKEGELKTKPTQYAVRELNSAGLQPDIIIARASVPIDKKRKDKIAFNCSMREEDIISAPDVISIYEVPINFEKDNISEVILKKMSLRPRGRDLKEWGDLVHTIINTEKPVRIGIVGKYFNTGDFVLTDSYLSVLEAVKHAAFFIKRKPVIEWLNAEDFDTALNPMHKNNLKKLSEYNGIVIPGGFGERGIEGKIAVTRHCRENKIPYFGLCYGMQIAVIEFARSVLGWKQAHTTEINAETSHPVIDILPEQKKNLAEKNFGASMRLGAYPAVLKKGSIAYSAYKKYLVSERHRHRYEVNPIYVEELEKKGLVFSGFSSDKKLMEIIELSHKEHPFFLGTQFHPEFKSRPLNPHPLFVEFIKTSIKH